jgi:long-chain acyl-CoA synthetase
MEQTNTTAATTTGSQTIADLLPRSVELFGDRVAQKHKVGDEWREITFAQLGEIVSEIGRESG